MSYNPYMNVGWEKIKEEWYQKTKDTAFVKFSTKNWVDGEAEMHYYEGTWQTIKEDGVYKMLKSKIKEVENPAWDWYYEWQLLVTCFIKYGQEYFMDR